MATNLTRRSLPMPANDDNQATPCFFLSEAWEAAHRFIAGFDELTYRDWRPARLLASQVWAALCSRPRAAAWERTVLDSLPGRLYLWLRARRSLRQLRDWRGEGTFLRRYEAYDHLLGSFAGYLRAPRRALATHDYVGTDLPRLTHLVPGRLRPPGLDAKVAALHAQVLDRHEDLRAALPNDPGWMRPLIRFAMDTLDSAEVFWRESRSPGGIVYSHLGSQDLALALEGRRAGRTILALQHGYFYDTIVWEPGFCDLYCTWDGWSSRVLERRSGGTIRTCTVGPFGMARQLAREREERRPGSGPPRLLLLTSSEPDEVFHRYASLYEEICGPGVPWEVLWKPHQRTAPSLQGFGPSCRRVAAGATYDLMMECDLVLSPHSSTLAEARFLGCPAACLADPRETWVRDWCESNGVPVLLPSEDVVSDLEEVLQRPPLPALTTPWGPDSPRRLAAMADAAFRGEDPAGAAQLASG